MLPAVPTYSFNFLSLCILVFIEWLEIKMVRVEKNWNPSLCSFYRLFENGWNGGPEVPILKQNLFFPLPPSFSSSYFYTRNWPSFGEISWKWCRDTFYTLCYWIFSLPFLGATLPQKIHWKNRMNWPFVQNCLIFKTWYILYLPMYVGYGPMKNK